MDYAIYGDRTQTELRVTLTGIQSFAPIHAHSYLVGSAFGIINSLLTTV